MIASIYIAGALCAAVGIYLWQHRRLVAAGHFGVLLLASSWWTIAYALELTATTPVSAYFWTRLQYFGITLVPPFWLLAIRGYTQQPKTRNKRLHFFLIVGMVITLIIVWTNEYHHLFYPALYWDGTKELAKFTYDYGPLFYINAAYTYVLLALGTLLLIKEGYSSHLSIKKGMLSVLMAQLFAWGGNVAHLLNLDLWGFIDPTPMALGAGSAIMAWGLYRHRLLAVIPLARASIIDKMPSGVIVTNDQGIVLDINKAALRLLLVQEQDVLNTRVTDSLPNLGALVKDGQSSTFSIVQSTFQKQTRVVRANIDKLDDGEGTSLGYLYTLEDITQTRRAEDQMAGYASELENTVDEIREYSYVFAHDLRGPVLTMQGFVGELSERLTDYLTDLPRVPDETILRGTKESLDMLDSATLRLAQLASAMLDLSTCSTRQLDVDYISPQMALEDAVLKLEENGYENIAVSSDRLGPVLADQAALKRIFYEFLRAFYERNTTNHVVEVRAELVHRRDIIELALVSQDVQIAENEREMLFTVRHIAGPDGATRVEQGLACARALARLHHGRVWCQITPLFGTRLVFELPTTQMQNIMTTRNTRAELT